MTKELLKEKVGKVLNVSQSEIDLAFELMLKKIANLLDFDDALKIPDIGIFTLKKEPLPREERLSNGSSGITTKRNLIYAPADENAIEDSNAMYISFDLDSPDHDNFSFSENVFNIGIGKPIITPSGIKRMGETTDGVMKTTIEERVTQLVTNSEKIPGFDIWSEYLSSEDSEHSGEESAENLEENIENDLKQIISEKVEGASDRVSEDSSDDTIEKVEDISDSVVDEKDEQEGELLESENQLEISEEDTSDEIKWNWGEELKEELEVTDDDIESGTDPDKIESATKEKNGWEIFDPLENEINSDEDIEGVDEDDLLSTSEEEEEETESFNAEKEETPENSSEEIEEEDEPEESAGDRINETIEYSPNDNIPAPVKKETNQLFRMGKFFWLLVAAFILIGAGGIYYLFFVGGDDDSEFTDNVPDTLINRRLQPLPKTPESMVRDDTGLVALEEDLTSENLAEDTSQLSIAQADANDASNQLDDVITSTSSVTTTTTSLPAEDVKQNTTTAVQIDNGLYKKFPGEKQISNLIFEFNGQYSLQVSSWNNKAKAEAEARRLQNVGYNAFIVETYLNALRSTWYRVRVGFFNSEQEAIQYRMNNRF